MSKRERQEHEREERRHEQSEQGQREEPHGTGYGTERSVYEEYLARKWQGSAPPSPEAYARAIRLWRQLPGSIVAAPADLGTIPEPAPGVDSKEPRRSDSESEQGNRS